MSLINEALKKAQRVRTEDATDALPPMPGDNGVSGGPRIAKRKQARSTQTTILLGVGAIVLIVLSAVTTVFFINRPAADTAAPTVAKSAPAAAPAAGTTPSPAVTAPVITPPVVAPPPLAAAPVPATPAETQPAPAPAATAAPAAVPPAETAASAPLGAAKLPPTETLAPSTEPTRPAESASGSAKADERIMAFVDSIRVTGIRSSGDGSRVLMNERVYRVNEIVERTLGVRLIKVSTDSLTFADANGVTYVKFF